MSIHEQMPTLQTPPHASKLSEDVDITLRSLDGSLFRCSRARLIEGSNVFKDMFESLPEEKESIIDMAEPTETLGTLVRIIYEPPEELPPPVARPKFKPGEPDVLPPEEPSPSLIPLDEIRNYLYHLANKYQLTDAFIKPLHSHLLAHARTSPLHVYSLASFLGLEDISSNASQFLLTPPVLTYSVEKARIITTVEAFHNLLRLQTFRENALRQILREEQVFPHDYLICRHHGTATRVLWDYRRQNVLDRLDAGTDVAEEMKSCLEAVANCPDCKRGVNSVVEMVRYKCYRVPRRICDLPVPEEADITAQSAA
ncbi:uncharacterized protein EI90DRAFT_3051564 [Cantharellus anzutake]|uniref:uncharacterized protein n=1 Tax=Cantharellus anzutake TaxID=1750568 RepID=UPI001907F1F4|nr:uncharacterized protein EI90DRAFT_3051564 [Cantharellus anzutake]KAF8334246.1 hypothetical protein EI90DRAFT_3051564 [Cantharellus anzutake]